MKEVSECNGTHIGDSSVLCFFSSNSVGNAMDIYYLNVFNRKNTVHITSTVETRKL